VQSTGVSKQAIKFYYFSALAAQVYITGCRGRKKVAFIIESRLTFVQIHGLIILNNEGG